MTTVNGSNGWNTGGPWRWVVRGCGIGIIVYETAFENTDRPSLLLLAGAMIFGPEFIRIMRGGNGGGK